jgi:F-type H+-transporting ATPase subunit delta
MAESVTIARPYAEAVFKIAKETGTLSQWSDVLQRLSAVAQDAEVASIVGNPKLSSEQLSEFFVSLAGSSDGNLSGLLSLMAANERLILLPEVAELFEAAKSNEEGIKDALLESAFALSEAQLAGLLPTLEEHFKTRLSATVQVAPELIGGIRVTVGDQVLDTSVRSKLESMAIALKN